MDQPHALWIELVIAAAMLIGTFLMLVAGIGLLRFPDIWTRMHAAGKAGTLGISMIIAACVVFFINHDHSMLYRGMLAIFFQFLTTPAATHMLSRASYVTEYPVSDRTEIDELKTYLPCPPDQTFGEE